MGAFRPPYIFDDKSGRRNLWSRLRPLSFINVMKSNFSRYAALRRFVFPTLLMLASYLFWLGAILSLIYLLPPQRPIVENFDVSPTFYDRNGTLFHARLSSSQEWLLPVPLEETGKWLPLVAVAVEDSRFYTHGITRTHFQRIRRLGGQGGDVAV